MSVLLYTRQKTTYIHAETPKILDCVLASIFVLFITFFKLILRVTICAGTEGTIARWANISEHYFVFLSTHFQKKTGGVEFNSRLSSHYLSGHLYALTSISTNQESMSDWYRRLSLGIRPRGLRYSRGHIHETFRRPTSLPCRSRLDSGQQNSTVQ